MEYSTKLKSELKSHYRKQATIQRRIEKEIVNTCDRYSLWCEAQKEENKRPLTILAEGDSWFKYVIGKAVIFQLEKLLNVDIQNLATPGDEVSDMLSPRKLTRLAKLLKRGPIQGWKYDFMLFSGGGNDLVGKDRFHQWLHPYKRGMAPKDVLNQKAIKSALDLLEERYKELIRIRDENSKKTQLLFHSYDFAIPDGRGVCWLGPWVQPGLEFRKVPKTKRREVVKLFLEHFDRRLDKLASKHENVTVIPTQGTLTDKDWSNELHPTNTGFKKIAKVFEAEIRNMS